MPKSTTLRRHNINRRFGFLAALRAAKKNLPPLQPDAPAALPASPPLAAYPSFADLLPPAVLAERLPRPDTPSPSPPQSLLSEEMARLALGGTQQPRDDDAPRD